VALVTEFFSSAPDASEIVEIMWDFDKRRISIARSHPLQGEAPRLPLAVSHGPDIVPTDPETKAA
jgi:hypothetical protein